MTLGPTQLKKVQRSRKILDNVGALAATPAVRLSVDLCASPSWTASLGRAEAVFSSASAQLWPGPNAFVVPLAGNGPGTCWEACAGECALNQAGFSRPEAPAVCVWCHARKPHTQGSLAATACYRHCSPCPGPRPPLVAQSSADCGPGSSVSGSTPSSFALPLPKPLRALGSRCSQSLS